MMLPNSRLLQFVPTQAGLLVALSLWLPSALAAPRFVASEIPRPSQEARIHLADIDGDGNSDVLVPHWSEAQGRELYIYLQQPDGRFPSLPSRKVEIKPEIIAYGTADLRSEAGAELVFVSSDAAYSFSSAIDSYSGNLQKLVDWPLIASTPQRKDLANVGTLPDLDKDGHADLLLPDDEGFGYFRGQGGERFEYAGKLLTVGGDPASVVRRNRGRKRGDVNINLGDTGELEVSSVAPTTSEFSLFLNEWRPEVFIGAGLLVKQDWIPALDFANFDDDALTDLAFIHDAPNVGEDAGKDGDGNRQQRRISVLLQNQDGTFAAQPHWAALVDDPRSSWQVREFTGDTQADLVRISGEGTQSTVYLYRNTAGTFDLERPDQVLRFSGLGLAVDFSDLDDDGKPELAASYFSTPVLDALRDTSIQRSRLIFANVATPQVGQGQEPTPIFSRRANYKFDESISADNILGITSFGNLQVDLDGDGRKDYLQVAGDGTLTANTIDATNLQIAADSFWQYVPNHIVVGFATEQLNADDRPDVLLHHSLHFTVLVSAE